MVIVIPTEIRNARAPSRRPTANAVLVITNVIAFVLGSSRFSLDAGQPWWNVFAYAFSHASFVHLIGNMYLLLLVGNPVNRRVGHVNYLLAYIGTALVLGILGRVIGVGGLRGSSGAIFAVVGIFLLLMPSARIGFSYAAIFPVTLLIGLSDRVREPVDWFLRFGRFHAKAWSLLILLPIIELWSLLMWRISLGEWTLVHPAHLFGLLCGVAVVLLLPRRISMGVP